MFKKLKVVLLLAGLGALAAGAAACSPLNTREQYENNGYDIAVTYDPNGGGFFGNDGVTLVDLFNPDSFEKDADGDIHIYLLDPTDPSRESGNDKPVSVTRQGYSIFGWYREKELRTDASGQPIDSDGNVLHVAEDGTYYYIADDGSRQPGDLSYTFSGRWDFENDTITYSEEEGSFAMTLYACWVPHFEFHYYYEEDGQWVLYDDTQYFDYSSVHSEGSTSSDDTILLPDWEEHDDVYGGTGIMVYEHKTESGDSFKFPSREGYTFNAAYTDPDCSEESRIEDGFRHQGTVDENGTVEGRIQNIYVKFDEGVRYRIKSAEQLSVYGNGTGLYEILCDLDFRSDTSDPVKWPAAFSIREFSGRIEAVGGEWTIKNVSFNHNDASTLYGGLFGYVTKDAVISGLTFENVTYDVVTVANDRLNMLNIGLFAGYVDEGARVSVTVGNATVRMNNELIPGTNYSFNLLVNGQTAGISRSGDVTFIIYGKDMLNGTYRYALPFTLDEDENPVAPKASVDENGQIDITFGGLVYSSEKEYQITIWRNNNEQ